MLTNTFSQLIYYKKVLPLHRISNIETMKINESNELDEMYNQAMKALTLHHFDEAITLLDEAAHKGSIAAILRIAGIYYFGIGIEPNTDKAIEYLRLAGDNIRALVNLGIVYYRMEATEENTRQAWRCFESAYKQDVCCAFYLGRCCFDKRVQEAEDYPILEEAETYFYEAFHDGGEPISGLYLWKIYQMQGTPNKGKEYLTEVRKRLEMMNSAKEHNNAADVLRSFGEYEMALPYIETCLSMVDEEKHPEYLETYAEVLYGLGERVKAEKTFARCMNIYQKECRNRDLRETWETMKEKFSDSISFRISIPQMEEYWGLSKAK